MSKYKGSRVEGGEYFDDLLGDNDSAGIYQGMGLANFESVKERITPGGPANKLQCRLCGNEVILTPEWEEIYYVSQNGPHQPAIVLPQGWQRSEVNYDCFNEVACPKCGGKGLAIHYDPEDARRLVKQAIQMGFINPQQEQQWRQRIAANLQMR